jgi:hypothetical protein
MRTTTFSQPLKSHQPTRLDYGEVRRLLDQFCEYVTEVRGTMIAQYTTNYSWSSTTAKWIRREDEREISILGVEPHKLQVPISCLRHHLKAAILMHTKHVGWDEEVFVTIEFAVESGIWYVFSCLEQRHYELYEPLGPLIPQFWEGRDDELQEKEASIPLCRNFAEWLYRNTHCLCITSNEIVDIK